MPDKYEEEIDEILRQAGELTSGKGGARRHSSFLGLIWLQIKRSLGGRALSISPGRVMLVAVVLLLTALVMRISLVAWAGLILFIVGYAMFFVKPKPDLARRSVGVASRSSMATHRGGSGSGGGFQR